MSDNAENRNEEGTPTINRVKDDLVAFYLWGVLIGGAAPPLVFLSLSWIGFDPVHPNLLKIALTASVLFLFICAFALCYELKRANSGKYDGGGWVYSTVGVSAVVVMFLLILCTGGLVQSPFSFHLVYVPSVVAVAFRSASSLAGTIVVYGLVALLTCTTFPVSTILSANATQYLADSWQHASRVSQQWPYISFMLLLYVTQLIAIYRLKKISERGRQPS